MFVRLSIITLLTGSACARDPGQVGKLVLHSQFECVYGPEADCRAVKCVTTGVRLAEYPLLDRIEHRYVTSDTECRP